MHSLFLQRAARLLLVSLTLAALLVRHAAADDTTHIYQQEEFVKIYANKIGPFNNPLETYAFFEMPGCPPAHPDHKFPSLGEALAGDELLEMKTRSRFGLPSVERELCRFTPSVTDVATWKRMVDEQYWYQLVSDDLPMWATFGKMMPVVDHRAGGGGAGNDTATDVDAEAPQKSGSGATAGAVGGKPAAPSVPGVYLHKEFAFGINGNRIVAVNLTAQNLVPIQLGKTYAFTYSVSFAHVDREFEHRFDRYLDDSFFEHKIHWFSIFNSFMMVMFLVGLVVTILSRTIKSDYARMTEERLSREEGKEDWTEDCGWKILHADVHRVPASAALLCALTGTGMQLAVVITVVTAVSIVTSVYTSSGSLATCTVLTYTGTSFLAGYISARQLAHYAALSPPVGSEWIRCMSVTAIAFPGLILLSGFLLNFVAIAYDSAQAIAVGGMIVMMLLWLLVACPLVVLGTIVGRHQKVAIGAGRAELPRINNIPRFIPKLPWYRSRAMFIVSGGILPFGSIFIELYFVFTSFWNYKLYYVYGFMLLVAVIAMVVTACVSVVSIYFLLNSEDHRWQWTSFGLGASTALYVFLYAAYFFAFKTRMSGFFMLAYYFVYMSLFSVAVGLLCGSVGFCAAQTFVSRIYRNVKAD